MRKKLWTTAEILLAIQNEITILDIEKNELFEEYYNHEINENTYTKESYLLTLKTGTLINLIETIGNVGYWEWLENDGETL